MMTLEKRSQIMKVLIYHAQKLCLVDGGATAKPFCNSIFSHNVEVENLEDKEKLKQGRNPLLYLWTPSLQTQHLLSFWLISFQCFFYANFFTQRRYYQQIVLNRSIIFRLAMRAITLWAERQLKPYTKSLWTGNNLVVFCFRMFYFRIVQIYGKVAEIVQCTPVYLSPYFPFNRLRIN